MKEKIDFVNEEKEWFVELLKRLRKKDFSGNSGVALKNSFFQLLINVVAKAGSIAFTVILARLLLPELFGLYSLALSTIILLAAFSDLGVGQALIHFVSKELGKNKEGKAKAYFIKLFKYKIYLVLVVSIILIISSYFIATYYYQKPIFFALLSGGIYVPIVALLGFFESVFKSYNNFKVAFIKEIIFQVLRFVLVPISILLFFKFSLSTEVLISGTILVLSFAYLVSLVYLFFISKKKIGFLKSIIEKISNSENLILKKFLFPLSLIALSGMFFGYIDILMLGHFVSEEFIGYYSSVFNLAASASILIGFTGSALLPIFSRMHGKALKVAFNKTIVFTFFISLIAAVITFFVAPVAISLIYGPAYNPSVILLRIFSLIVFILPPSLLYDSYFISQGKTGILAKLLIFTTILNIVLNYAFITYGLKLGMMQAVIGAAIATIVSRVVYLLGVSYFNVISKKQAI